MKYLVVGLGNPGPEYELTRHNVGFLILDQLADLHKSDFESGRYGDISRFKYKGKSIHLVKPSTFVNLSGKAVNYWLASLKMPKEHLLVVADDVSLPFGKLRLRAKGADAGHNGLKNIDQLTGGNDYPRLRIGIGSDYLKGRQVDYVLSRFNVEEFETLPEHINRACEVVHSFFSIGIDRAMNKYN